MAQHRKWKLWFLYFNCSLILSFFKLFPWKELFGAGVVCVLWEAKILLRDVNVRENEGFILTAAAQLLKNYIYEWLLHRPGTSLGLGASRDAHTPVFEAPYSLYPTLDSFMPVLCCFTHPSLKTLCSFSLLPSQCWRSHLEFMSISIFSILTSWPWHLCWNSFGHI